MAGKLQEIFENAIDLSGGERDVYLRGACGADAALRAEVDALLLAHERAAGFMASPTAQQPPLSTAPTIGAATTASDSLREAPGSRIGAYKLLQIIGEGGFGSVFMAEQEQPVRRKVALKIIKLGMDTRQVVARFEQERQALAILDHPNIAKVFDAGATETGRPYFVMELVKGEPIVDYCDRHNLSIKERLDLFSQVCGAVQHAHTKGIIHRDIKPSNILVSNQDGRPSIKVIDFGIAKATASKLTEKTLFTEHRQLIGTPEYMSPEQAEGSLDIDTRTDVYSLGVVLYELLTGTTPFTSQELRSAAYAEIQRIIREIEPPKPSTRLSENSDSIASIAVQRRIEPRKLGVLVRGELDWIVMKALEKDRQRRYESASSLGSDVQRYLNREPVSAGPPSAGYKFRKFVQRHRGKVVAAGLLAAVLVVGAIGTSAGLVWALNEKARADEETKRAVLAATAETMAKEEAQRRLAQLEKATDILSSIFESLNPREIARSGRPLQQVLADNLDTAIAELDGETVGDSRAVLNLQVRLGHSLLAMGDGPRAVAVMEKARKAAMDTLGPDDTFTIHCDAALAMAYADVGKTDLAISMLEEVLRKHTARATAETDIIALTRHNLGLILRGSGQAAQALPLFEAALAERKASLGADHAYTLSTLNALATTYGDLGKIEKSLPLLREAVDGYQRTLGPNHPSTLAALNNLGSAYRYTGETALAISTLEEVLRICRETLGNSSPNTMATMTTLGSTYSAAGMPDKAAVLLSESLTLMRARQGNDHPNTMATVTGLGQAYWAMGQYDKSIPLYEEGLALYTKNFGRDRAESRGAAMNLGINYHDGGRFKDALPLLKDTYERTAADPNYGFVASALADTYSQLGMKAEATSVASAALALVRKKQPDQSPALAGELARYGASLLKGGHADAAEPLLRECLSIREKALPDDWITFNTKSLLGEALAKQSNFVEAGPLLLAGYQGLKDRESTIPKGAEFRLTDAIDRLIALCEATQKPNEAVTWRNERAKYPAAATPK